MSADLQTNIDNELVTIFYSNTAEKVAFSHQVLILDQARTFRKTRYVAFYFDNAIRNLFEIIGEAQENCTVSNHELLQELQSYLQLSDTESFSIFPVRWVQSLNVINDLVSVKTNRPVHYSYGQPRYTGLNNLLTATKTSELASVVKSRTKKRSDKSYIDYLKAKKLPVPLEEEKRIDDLYSYNLLDTEREANFDNLTRIAAQICGTSISVISLVDAERQWFKSTFGVDAQETPREVSFCQYAIMDDILFEVNDALQDDRFKNNPLVTGAPDIRFYAGAPLKTNTGYNIGTLCVIDNKPKALSEEQKLVLRALANEVMARFEMRKNNFLLAEANNNLQNTLAELKSVQLQLEQMNDDLLQSINYAKRIQQAILPNIDKLLEIHPKSFVLYRPKDIVSGDFFWFTERRGKLILAVADCTGHGVPGAFMSLIGMNALEKIVKDRGLIDPAIILSELDYDIVKTLQQDLSGNINLESIDLSIISINYDRNQLVYAAAMRLLWLFRNNECIEYKGDRFCVAGGSVEEKSFTNHTIDLVPGDRIYIFSDGITDQFGGEQRMRKYTYRRLKDFLMSIQQLPIEKHQELINDEINRWQGDIPQTDDITIIGLEYQQM